MNLLLIGCIFLYISDVSDVIEDVIGLLLFYFSDVIDFLFRSVWHDRTPRFGGIINRTEVDIAIDEIDVSYIQIMVRPDEIILSSHSIDFKYDQFHS